MTDKRFFKGISASKGRLLKTTCLKGPLNMAADVMMIEDLIQSSELSISFRFYTWEGVWLSIGHNQKEIPRKWLKLIKEKKLNVVRRPSGGGAVLHCGGLTYAFAWKSAPNKKHEAYIQGSKWIINGFKKLGIPLQFGDNPNRAIFSNCFESATRADLIDQSGCKRVGSAQFWKKGVLLQHGEIIMAPSKELWQAVFDNEPPLLASIGLSVNSLIELLTKEVFISWPEVSWSQNDFSRNELKVISSNSQNYLP